MLQQEKYRNVRKKSERIDLAKWKQIGLRTGSMLQQKGDYV